jgi:hypothetical protein
VNADTSGPDDEAQGAGQGRAESAGIDDLERAQEEGPEGADPGGAAPRG